VLDARKDFPFLDRRVNGSPLIYFDNAATTQKPRLVMDALLDVYSSGIANVHRAVSFLAEEVTERFEGGRETVARFIGAQSREVVFVRNSTEGINVLCGMLGRSRPLRVLTTTLEHHSNLLPWAAHGQVDFLPWTPDGRIDLDALDEKLAAKPDLVAIARASNFLGVLHPVREIIAASHAAGVPVLVDASQSIAHERHDVRELDCDFLVFSGHKIYGPSGTGALFIRNDWLETLRPFFIGGSMIKEAHALSYTENDIPHRFEAGTPNIEGAVALAAALDYISSLGMESVAAHEAELIRYAKCRLAQLPAVALLGPAPGEPCAPLVPFQVRGLDPGAVAKLLGNRANVIVRSGFLCAQPAHDQLGVGPTVRASFGIYNTKAEIDCMIETLQAIVRVM